MMPTKRITKELAELSITYIVNGEISIEFYPRQDMQYVFTDFARYPFMIPQVRIINPEINGKNWLTNSFEIQNKYENMSKYPEFAIDSKGNVSLMGLRWSPDMRLIDIMNIIELALQNKRNI